MQRPPKLPLPFRMNTCRNITDRAVPDGVVAGVGTPCHGRNGDAGGCRKVRVRHRFEQYRWRGFGAGSDAPQPAQRRAEGLSGLGMPPTGTSAASARRAAARGRLRPPSASRRARGESPDASARAAIPPGEVASVRRAGSTTAAHGSRRPSRKTLCSSSSPATRSRSSSRCASLPMQMSPAARTGRRESSPVVRFRQGSPSGPHRFGSGWNG